MHKLVYNEDLTFNNFYKDGMHDNIPEPNLDITNELLQYLLDLGTFKLKSEPTKYIYTIKDIDFFEKVIQEPTDPPISQPSTNDRLAFLEAEHILNVSSILDLDFRVTDIEFSIEAPMNINLKNIKGELKTMARTPYQMMKTLILAGEYNEADMTKKINFYYEKDKLSLKEKEELIGLIEANKIVD